MKIFLRLLFLTFFGAALAQTERRIRKVSGIPSNRLMIQEDAVQILLALKYNLPTLQQLRLNFLLSKIQQYSRNMLQGTQKRRLFAGFAIGQKLYFQKCMFALKRWARSTRTDCENAFNFVSKNKTTLNTKADELFSKAKSLRQTTINQITKSVNEKLGDKKNSEEIINCLNSTKKYYIERIEATGPKLEDDYKQMQKYAFDDLETVNKSITDFKAGLKKKYIDSEQELKRCKGIRCLLETSERLNQEYKNLGTKVQVTAKGAETIVKNFSNKSGNLYQPYVTNVSGLQKDSEAALNKCLTAKPPAKK